MTSTISKPPAFYIPRNLDPEILRPEHREHAYYFLNLVHWRNVSWQADPNGYVRLKHDYLIKVIPKGAWQEIRGELINAGVVVCDKTSIAGKQSYGYKLAKGYRKTHRVVCSDPELIKTIAKVYAKRSVKLKPVHEWLLGRFGRLAFDADLANEIIATMRPDASSNLTPKRYRALLRESCQRLINRDWTLTCDRFGRVHTLITSLPKALRGCLSVDGRSLVSLDLANSQPLIAGICARHYYRTREAKKRLLQRHYSDSLSPYCYRDLVPASQVNKDHPDIEAYIELCEQGEFYESLMRAGEDRGKFKERFYKRVFFGKPGRSSGLRDRFEDQFPAANEI